MGSDVDERLDRLVTTADLDGLVRLVDDVQAGRDWDGLVGVGRRCRSAIATGRQLWPIVSLVEYRLALHAPGPHAARVVADGSAPFAVGPLTEVAASTHTWADLAPHLGPGPATAFTAHERVLRGEHLTGDGRVDPHVLEVPLELQPWEPRYVLAAYTDAGGEFPGPPLPSGLTPTPLPDGPEPVADREATEALVELAGAWTRQSNGRAEAVAVAGDHLGALAALGVPSARVVEVDAARAMAWMAWAAASGGAHGRRRGAAAGRFAAWWAVGALGGLTDEWPLPAREVEAVTTELRWFWWDAAEPLTGWQLRLAVWDPHEGLAWAVAATDHAL